MKNIPIVKLNNGVEMPQIGFGTYLIPKDKIIDTIGMAYEMGYRQFDTAGRYRNQEYIAKAMRKYGIKRENVFLTTKIHIDQLFIHRYHGGVLRFLNIPVRSIRAVIEEEFKNLNTDYIDLFLIHYPLPGYLKCWEELCKYYEEGRIRAIGVCSFLPPTFDSLNSVSDIVPAVNQFEISPLNAQTKLVEYCQNRNIQVQAMGTLSHWRSNEPRIELLDNELLITIANKYDKSVAQVVWRWLIQRNIIIIPKSWYPAHIKENINILDFELSEDDMKAINNIDCGHFLNYNAYEALQYLPQKYRGWDGFK